MILVFGKFDPETNPVPFTSWSKHFSAAEIELPQYFAWKPRARQYFQKWVMQKHVRLIPRVSMRPNREVSEFEDWLSLWNEAWGSQTLYWSIYSGRRAWDEDLARVQLERFESLKQKYWVEWGQNDGVSTTRFFEAKKFFGGLVVDPGWHPMKTLKAQPNLRFKLHGWHEARWMRRYGPVQAEKIRRICQQGVNKNAETTTLVLSYSGKVEEAKLFTESSETT
jgi:hypothetical protein